MTFGYVLVLAPEGDPTLQEFIRKIPTKGCYSVKVVGGVAEVAAHVSGDMPTILLCSVRLLDEIKDLQDVSQQLRTLSKIDRFCIMAVNRFNRPELPRLLDRTGCASVLVPGVTPAGIRQKVIHQLEVLEKSAKRPRAPAAGEIRLLDPLTIRGDCWLLRDLADLRLHRDQWMIDLIGPGTAAGRWRKMDFGTFSRPPGLQHWEWRPNQPHRNAFVDAAGVWIFQGQRPTFSDWHWTFVSPIPRLFYVLGGQVVCDYFQLDQEGTFCIRKNSDIARSKWPDIRASILGEYVIESEAKKAEAPPSWTFSSAVPERGMGAVATDKPKPPPWRDLISDAKKDRQINDRRAEEEALAAWRNLLSPTHSTQGDDLFTRIDTPSARHAYIIDLSAGESAGTVWTRGQKSRFSVGQARFDNRMNCLLVPLPEKVTYKRLMDEVEKGGDQLFVNLALARGSLFFVTGAAGVRASLQNLLIEIPSVLYEVQRRRFPRLDIPPGLLVLANCQDVTGRVVNISAGGLAFEVDPLYSGHFHKGATLEKVEFSIGGKLFQCGAEVRWERPSADLLKVGLQFVNMSASDQEKLNLFILEQGHDVMMGGM